MSADVSDQQDEAENDIGTAYCQNWRSADALNPRVTVHHDDGKNSIRGSCSIVKWLHRSSVGHILIVYIVYTCNENLTLNIMVMSSSTEHWVRVGYLYI